MDVVIVTLMRKTLKYAIYAAKRSIHEPRFIFVKGKGFIGDLRNEGLEKAQTKYVCFIDDDIIVPKNWFNECVNTLEQNNNIVCVLGNTEKGYTFGAMVCKTEMLKSIGGFTKADSYLLERINQHGMKYVIREDIICKHLVSELETIRHTRHWLLHGWGTEARFGILNLGITDAYKKIFKFLVKGEPESSLMCIFCLIKSLFVFAIKQM